ncbi:hypothetical protein Taro_024585 [Colocasia esculenta]|uniref:Glucan endo-1,3-beta-D-glucosidase n=1 Tax=Colocasia esculenta TaxID=4460 RepID=A0A843VBR0_COLES|nr:hypothetical protein [Colocasia esculenta]
MTFSRPGFLLLAMRVDEEEEAGETNAVFMSATLTSLILIPGTACLLLTLYLCILIYESPAAPSDWVRDNVLAYWPDVRFSYVTVGNEVIFNKGVAQYIYRALAATSLRD